MIKSIHILLFAIILILQALVGLSVLDPQHCFDVLDRLPQKEIKNIYFMSFKEVAHTHPAADILSCYLIESHPGDKSVTDQYFDVYQKCDEYRRENFEPFGYQQLQELESLGLPFSLEKYLWTKIKTGNKAELEQGILYVQDVLSKEIELSRYYKDYKNYILMKYKPNSARSLAHSNTNFKDILDNNLAEYPMEYNYYI